MAVQPLVIQEWDENHARWNEFVQCLEAAAPEQAAFVLGDYARGLPCFLFVALLMGGIIGFLRFGIQPIGSEERCSPLVLNGMPLMEANIHAFAVSQSHRNRGVGTALQKHAITRARELGCYQLVSHTGYENHANHHLKLSLGFCAQPEGSGSGGSIRFLMPLAVASGPAMLND